MQVGRISAPARTAQRRRPRHRIGGSISAPDNGLGHYRDGTPPTASRLAPDAAASTVIR